MCAQVGTRIVSTLLCVLSLVIQMKGLDHVPSPITLPRAFDWLGTRQPNSKGRCPLWCCPSRPCHGHPHCNAWVTRRRSVQVGHLGEVKANACKVNKQQRMLPRVGRAAAPGGSASRECFESSFFPLDLLARLTSWPKIVLGRDVGVNKRGLLHSLRPQPSALPHSSTKAPSAYRVHIMRHANASEKEHCSKAYL